MSAPAHTPGPWRYEKSQISGGFYITGSNEYGGMILPILGRACNFPRNVEANARLIAAAPDLLEALKDWCSQYDGWSDAELAKRANPATIARYKASRAAIAKAEGRS